MYTICMGALVVLYPMRPVGLHVFLEHLIRIRDRQSLRCHRTLNPLLLQSGGWDMSGAKGWCCACLGTSNQTYSAEAFRVFGGF